MLWCRPSIRRRDATACESVRPPRVSVVVPLYNKEQYVARCLSSIRAQTFADYELIVVDDGSTDAGPAVARRLLRTGDQLIAQSNAGPGRARNTGIEAARGELVAFLDADDEWLPGFLATMVSLLALCPEAAFAGCRYEQTGGTLLRVPRCGRRGPYKLVLDYAGACARAVGFPNNSSCTVVRRAALQQVGGFPPVVPNEDVILWVRLGLLGPFAYTPRVLARVHSSDGDSSLSARCAAQRPPGALPGALAIAALARAPERTRRERAALASLAAAWQATEVVSLLRAGDVVSARREARVLLLRGGLGLRPLGWCVVALAPPGLFRWLESRVQLARHRGRPADTGGGC